MVGHLLQYHPAFLKLKELVRAGELGRIQYIYSNRLNLGRIRREENVFWSFAPHDISMILSLAGEPPEQVQRDRRIATFTKRIADVTTTHLDFANGIQAHVFVSWLHPFKEQKLVVVGDARHGGVRRRPALGAQAPALPTQDRLARRAAGAASRGRRCRCRSMPAEPLQLECRHFLDCVRDRCQPRTDVRAKGLRVLRVLDCRRARCA